MTDEKFKELVNLYLDDEIAPIERVRLKEELSLNDSRMREFEERCRLHHAMRLALCPQEGQRARAQDRPVWASFSAWLIGIGFAACFALGGLLMFLLVNRTTELSARATGADLLVGTDSMPELSRLEMERYAALRRVAARKQCSLVAQLRLLGLNPEIVPRERMLQRVDPVVLVIRDDRMARQLQLIEEVQNLSPIPQSQLFESLEHLSQEEASVPGTSWPSGFQTSLAGF